MIYYSFPVMSGEQLIAKVREIQERHPGLRIGGMASVICADPDQMELFDAEVD